MATKPKSPPLSQQHSTPCCGECRYCHKDHRDGKVKCFLYPPEYVGTDGEEDMFIRPEVDVRDPACKDIGRNTQ